MVSLVSSEAMDDDAMQPRDTMEEVKQQPRPRGRPRKNPLPSQVRVIGFPFPMHSHAWMLLALLLPSLNWC